MVKEKDEATKREAQRREHRDRMKRDLDAKTVRFKWQVIEHTPSKSGWGYYDTDTPAKNVVVADDFGTEPSATKWMNEHEPDEGNTLYVKRRRLVRNTYYTWM